MEGADAAVVALVFVDDHDLFVVIAVKVVAAACGHDGNGVDAAEEPADGVELAGGAGEGPAPRLADKRQLTRSCMES